MSLELDADLFFGAIDVCLSNCFEQADDRDGDCEPRVGISGFKGSGIDTTL